MTRQISSCLGRNEIVIRDIVENAGFEPAPHMMLYHFNFGFPLLDSETQIQLPSAQVISREPETPLDGLDNWCSPQPGYEERVFYHEQMSAKADGIVNVTVRNPQFPVADKPLSVWLAWKSDTLPVLVQWKMPGEGIHVLGIEPANCHVEGRAAERARGTLVMLNPGESVEYFLALTLLEE